MSDPDHISESLETNFWGKILKFFDVDPGWKKFGPQHCFKQCCGSALFWCQDIQIRI